MNTTDLVIKIFQTAENTFPRISVPSIFQKIKFLSKVFWNWKIVERFYSRIENVGFSFIFNKKQNALGAVLWPYINCQWDIEFKLDRIATHYETIKKLPRFLLLDDGELNKILDLSSISKDVTICFDHPTWFIREGEIVLNLFKADLRVVSIAFIFSQEENDAQSIIIGAIQGIHRGVPSQESLSIFRSLTKDFAGLRPRSFLIEILRIIAKLTDTKKIFAVADENRQHRHKYFGKQENKKLLSDYNQIWCEHGGIPCDSGFYCIPINPKRKEIADIPSKKRSMYRRRNKILQFINQNLEKKFRDSFHTKYQQP